MRWLAGFKSSQGLNTLGGVVDETQVGSIKGAADYGAQNERRGKVMKENRKQSSDDTRKHNVRERTSSHEENLMGSSIVFWITAENKPRQSNDHDIAQDNCRK